jgi:hypothetical protein
MDRQCGQIEVAKGPGRAPFGQGLLQFSSRNRSEDDGTFVTKNACLLDVRTSRHHDQLLVFVPERKRPQSALLRRLRLRNREHFAFRVTSTNWRVLTSGAAASSAFVSSVKSFFYVLMFAAFVCPSRTISI